MSTPVVMTFYIDAGEVEIIIEKIVASVDETPASGVVVDSVYAGTVIEEQP